jgi:predicted nuclease of predicted toxin-antitoxin system
MARGTKKKPKGVFGFLLNAHIPAHTVDYLTRRNYRVEQPPKGMPDHEIVQLAKRRNMVLITQDRGMTKHVSGHRHPGIVIIRGRGLGSEGVTELVEAVLSLFKPIEDISGQIIDISRDKLQITLPNGTQERYFAE